MGRLKNLITLLVRACLEETYFRLKPYEWILIGQTGLDTGQHEYRFRNRDQQNHSDYRIARFSSACQRMKATLRRGLTMTVRFHHSTIPIQVPSLYTCA